MPRTLALERFYQRMQTRLQNPDSSEFRKGIDELQGQWKTVVNHLDRRIRELDVEVGKLDTEVEELHDETKENETPIPPEQAAVPDMLYEESPIEQEPQEPTDPVASMMYEFCRLVAGRANLPLREVWRDVPPPPRLPPANDEHPTTGPNRRQSVPPPILPPVPSETNRSRTQSGTAYPTTLDVNRYSPSLYSVPMGIVPSLLQYLQSSAAAAFHHVLFLIRQMNNPRVSHMNVFELMQHRDYGVMFSSWVAHLVQYWRTVNGDSPIYRSQLTMAVLSRNLNRHYAYFSNL